MFRQRPCHRTRRAWAILVPVESQWHRLLRVRYLRARPVKCSILLQSLKELPRQKSRGVLRDAEAGIARRFERATLRGRSIGPVPNTTTKLPHNAKSGPISSYLWQKGRYVGYFFGNYDALKNC